jgi:hypothetical protein
MGTLSRRPLFVSLRGQFRVAPLRKNWKAMRVAEVRDEKWFRKLVAQVQRATDYFLLLRDAKTSHPPSPFPRSVVS